MATLPILSLPCPDKDVHACLDDLIICSQDADTHFASLCGGCSTKASESWIKSQITKCEFLKFQKITFLGHTVDGDTIHTM